MPKYKLTASWPELDKEAFANAYREHLIQAMTKAARKFLRAAIPLVPVFTGFARGGFQTLEELVGRFESGKIKRKNRTGQRVKETFIKRGYYYRGIEKSTISARPFATEKEKIITTGRITKASTQARMVFYFQIDIDYFSMLDKEKWGSFKAGQEAFDRELREQINRNVPDIAKYFVRREIK